MTLNKITPNNTFPESDLTNGNNAFGLTMKQSAATEFQKKAREVKTRESVKKIPVINL